MRPGHADRGFAGHNRGDSSVPAKRSAAIPFAIGPAGIFSCKPALRRTKTHEKRPDVAARPFPSKLETTSGSALAELEGPAGLGLTVLLTLDHARIAGQE